MDFGPYVAFAPFGLEEVIYIYLLTSLRKYWAILDLNPPKIAEPLKNGLRERAILGSTLVLAPEQAMPVRL